MQVRQRMVSALKEELLKAQEGLVQRYSQQDILVKLMEKAKVKFNRQQLLKVEDVKDHGVVFLERGTEKAGYQHILKHAEEFKSKGISVSELPKKIFAALKQNRVVGYQGRDRGRPIYWAGGASRLCFAITVASNGYIVGANPTTLDEVEVLREEERKKEQQAKLTEMTLAELDVLPRREKPNWLKVGLF
jgi:hypothetical protein